MAMLNNQMVYGFLTVYTMYHYIYLHIYIYIHIVDVIWYTLFLRWIYYDISHEWLYYVSYYWLHILINGRNNWDIIGI